MVNDVFFILFKWRTMHPLLLMRGLCSVFEVFSLESGAAAPSPQNWCILWAAH